MSTMKREVCWTNENGFFANSVISWSSDDPLVLSINFHGSNELTWFLSRDLFSDAISDKEGRWHGEGDVKARMFPVTGGTGFRIILDTPYGYADLRTEEDLRSFLAATYEKSPRNQEDLNLDEELDRLMGE